MAKTYYELLGVPQDASSSDILQAYWNLEDELRVKGADSNDPRMLELRKAYEILSSLLQRREYDSQLAQNKPKSEGVNPSTPDDGRVGLSSLLEGVSTLPVMDSWQSTLETSASTMNAPSLSTMNDESASTMNDESASSSASTLFSMDAPKVAKDPFDDPELDAIFKSAQEAGQLAKKQDLDDPFANLNMKAGEPQLRPYKTPQKIQARPMPISPQQKANQSRTGIIVAIALVIVSVASIMVFVAIPAEELNTSTNISGNNVTRAPLSTSPPRATSTPQQVQVITQLEERGDEFYEAGDYDQAVTRYTQAISRGASLQLYFKRAQAFWMAHEFMDDREVIQALNDLDTAIEWDENFAEAHRLRGIIYYELWVAFGVEDDADQALMSLNTYIELIGVSADPTRDVTEALNALEAR